MVTLAGWSSYPGSVGHVTIFRIHDDVTYHFDQCITLDTPMLLCTNLESCTWGPSVRPANYYVPSILHAPCASAFPALMCIRVDLACVVHSAMRACKCTCSSVQSGRGWVVVGRVERVVALTELF